MMASQAAYPKRLGHRICGMTRLRVSVVTAVDASPRYRGCAELFISAWNSISSKSSFEFIPTVIRVNEKHLILQPNDLPIEHGCKKSSFVAQNVRSLACAFQSTELAMTSDVDMLPASSSYFDEIASRALESSAFTIGRDVLPQGQVPICYNIAPPGTWSKVFRLNSEVPIEEKLKQLWGTALERGPYSGTHGGDGWHFDQEFLYQLLAEFEKGGGRVLRLLDSATGHRRLDRSLKFPLLMRAEFRKVNEGKYSDFHIPLPAIQHRRLLADFLKRLDQE